MACYKKHKVFLIYSRLSTNIENVNGVIKYSKLEKYLKKTHLCVTSATNSYKKKKLGGNFSKNIYNLS